jgi:hypothetical protein
VIGDIMNKWEKFSFIFIIFIVIIGMISIATLIDKIWVVYLPDCREFEGIFIMAFMLFCLFCGVTCEKGIEKYHKDDKPKD